LQTLFLNNPVFFSQYLAPEVLKKQPYDKTVDWWCLGAVLYEMMYGLPPFYSRDTAEMYDNILYKPLRLRTNVSASARSILEGVSLLFFFFTSTMFSIMDVEQGSGLTVLYAHCC
jgi:serine/threonine protein kinase